MMVALSSKPGFIFFALALSIVGVHRAGCRPTSISNHEGKEIARVTEQSRHLLDSEGQSETTQIKHKRPLPISPVHSEADSHESHAIGSKKRKLIDEESYNSGDDDDYYNFAEDPLKSEPPQHSSQHWSQNVRLATEQQMAAFRPVKKLQITADIRQQRLHLAAELRQRQLAHLDRWRDLGWIDENEHERRTRRLRTFRPQNN